MKKYRSSLIVISLTIVSILALYTLVNIVNDDLYGRLIQTKDLSLKIKNERPTVTLILKKHLAEENAVEATIAITYDNSLIFQQNNAKDIDITIVLSDGYYYNPSGIVFKANFNDYKNSQNFGYLDSGFESSRFSIPVAPSINGFPFDDFELAPNISLYVNNQRSNFNLKVQKRIPGRVLKFRTGSTQFIILTRSSTEKCAVIISSIIFLILTILLVRGFFKAPKGLSTIEELVSIAGYLIAIAGFREIIGVSRISGVGTLEIAVILIPLISLFIGMIYSFNKGRKERKVDSA